MQYIDSRVTADAPVRRSGPAYFQKECRESGGESFRRYCSQTIAQLSHARRILLWMKTVLSRRAARRMALRKRSASTPCAFMTAAVKRNRPSVIAEEGDRSRISSVKQFRCESWSFRYRMVEISSFHRRFSVGGPGMSERVRCCQWMRLSLRLQGRRKHGKLFC